MSGLSYDGVESLDDDAESPPRTPRMFDQPPRVYIRLGFYTSLGVILLTLVVFLIYRLLAALSDVATPFIIGIVLALLLNPLTYRLEKKGLSRTAAIIVVFGGWLILLVGLGSLIIPRLVEQVSNFGSTGPKYLDNLRGHIDTWLAHHHKIVGVALPRNTNQIFAQFADKFTTAVQGSAGSLATLVAGSATTVVQFVISLMVMFYVLADLERLRARAFYLVPSRFRKTVRLYTTDVGNVFSDYIRGLVTVCAMYGITVILVLYALSIWKHPLVGYALLVGVCAGVLYSVPYVGALSIALMTFIIGFMSGGATFGAVTVVCVLSVNQVFDNVITPRVVGGGVGLHPVVALLALALGARLFGFWGLLLSVPIAASVQVVLFRLFPKLTMPTPESFLRDSGVHHEDAPVHKIMEDDPDKKADVENAEHPPPSEKAAAAAKTPVSKPRRRTKAADKSSE